MVNEHEPHLEKHVNGVLQLAYLMFIQDFSVTTYSERRNSVFGSDVCECCFGVSGLFILKNFHLLSNLDALSPKTFFLK